MKTKSPHPVYIWQHSDWPRFGYDVVVIAPLLANVRNLQGRLSGMLAVLGFDVQNTTMLGTLTDDITNSSEIEGVYLNPESVRSSIARRLGIDTDLPVGDDHYVEGLVDVMLDATANSDSPLTFERLWGWHAALFPTGYSGRFRITVGDWRKGDEPMQVVSGAMGKEKVHFEAPPSSDVPGEMESFLKWSFTDDADPVIKAAVAHLWVVTIHPFDDGNGRLSRTVADYFLSRSDGPGQRFYSMSAQINRQKKEYYEILEKTQKGTLDITSWIVGFLNCLEKAIKTSIATVRNAIAKGVFWQRVKEVPLNERQCKILNRLLDGLDGKLTTSKWAKMCHCSQDTALRDIRDLVDKGILRDSGEGSRNSNYILAEKASG
mgnify:FL=1